MKLTGNLKKQVENANSKEEAKELIKSAGMMLTDDEINMVAGGVMNEPQGENAASVEVSLESHVPEYMHNSF